MRSIRAVVIGITLAGIITTMAEAQQVRRRSGLWYGGGLGGAVARVGCDICVGSREGGFTGSLRIGGTLSQKVLLGVEASGWFRDRNAINRRLGTVSEVIYWYPSSRGLPYYFKGGVGVIAYRAHDQEGNEGGNAVTSTALQGQIGIGYDLPITRSISISPNATLVGSVYGGLKFNGAAVGSGQVTFFQFGIGVTRH